MNNLNHLYSKHLWGEDASSFNLSRWSTEVRGGDTCLRRESSECPQNDNSLNQIYGKRVWIPFGSGSKSCIGQGVAMAAVERLLEDFVKCFTVEKISPEYTFQFTQTPTMRIKDLKLKVASIV